MTEERDGERKKNERRRNNVHQNKILRGNGSKTEFWEIDREKRG